MPAAPKPSNETDRLDALWSFEILDTVAEAGFDAVTTLAAELCAAPIAIISLVDENRQWFKSQCGLDGVTQTGRDVAFCAHAILQAGILEVPDATADARFADNPQVTGEPHYRFYAGVPLITAGSQAIGTLCVLDRVPRSLTAAQRRHLERLAETTLGLITARATRLQSDERRLGLLDTALAQVTTRTEQLRALVQLAKMLSDATSAPEVIALARNAAQSLCARSRATIVEPGDAFAPAPLDDPQVATAQIMIGPDAGPLVVLAREDTAFTPSERSVLDLVAMLAGLALGGRRMAA